MIVQRRETSAAARSLRQWPLLVVVGGVLLGLAVAALGRGTWRAGCVLVGASLCAGAVERVVLRGRRAGLLQVRGQAFDVAVLGLSGVAIIVLAVWVHGR